MMKHLLTISVLLGSSLAFAALNEDPDRPVNIPGFGQGGCGDFLAARREGWTSSHTARAAEYVLGYVAAYNSFHRKDQVTVTELNSNTVVAILDKHCADHPKWVLWTAIRQLVSDLSPLD